MCSIILIMNCIDKMYKEIEEIIRKETLEQSRPMVFAKEIKYGFDDADNSVKESLPMVDFLSQIDLNNFKYDKKYFDENKARLFIEFIFKKYLCFNDSGNGEREFVSKVSDKIKDESNLLTALTSLENELLSIAGESDEFTKFFTNPYNALYKDEKGYYAVILNGKYTDVQRPFGYNANQLKKLVKESLDAYVEDFSVRFNSEKEKSAFLNKIKAEINKSQTTDVQVLEKEIETSIFNFLSQKGVNEKQFEGYLVNKGLRLVKQGNYYFRKKAQETYAEYKKIEFRY